jgi:hypothetical protein
MLWYVEQPPRKSPRRATTSTSVRMVAKGNRGNDVEEWLGMNLFYDTEYFRKMQQVADFHNESPYSAANRPVRGKK